MENVKSPDLKAEFSHFDRNYLVIRLKTSNFKIKFAMESRILKNFYSNHQNTRR